MDKQVFANRQRWYRDLSVKYELLKAMKDREVVIMDRHDHWKCIRGLFIRNIPFLNKVLNGYNVVEEDKNIYVSVAKYSSIPPFTMKLSERSNETSEWFTNQAHKDITSYDIFLDFDYEESAEFLEFKRNVFMFANHLIEFGIVFNIIPSGTGFQINIDSSAGYSNLTEETYLDKIESTKEIVEAIKNKFESLPFLCSKGVGTLPKIRKCEYSLVKDTVVLPFSNMQLDYTKFDYLQLKVPYILDRIALRGRGLKYFNEKFKKQHAKCFYEFCTTYFLFEDEEE